MFTETLVLYAAALGGCLLAAMTIAPALAGDRPPGRSVAVLVLSLAALLAWRAVPPFWHALRIGLYDAQDALLSAAAALALLMLAGTLRRRRD